MISRESGKTILVIEHDMHFRAAAGVPSRGDDTRQVFRDGSYEQAQADPKEKAYLGEVEAC
jgi:ABC-type uncharacterized transport system ATPase subunit